MRKKLLLCCALPLLAALVVFAAVAAGGNPEARARNVVTTGTINIELNGAQYNTPVRAVKASAGVSNAASFTDMMPGKEISMPVCVTNNETDAWIRVKAEVEVTLAGENEPTARPTFMLDGTETPVVSFFGGYFGGGSSWITADPADDYLYYNEPVGRGGTTTPLFTSVSLAPGLPNEYQDCTVKIIVTAEAVQVKNNNPLVSEPTLEKPVLDVTGWPVS